MIYQIYLKDKPVIVEPSTYFPDMQSAILRRLALELDNEQLAGKLEVRASRKP